MKCWYSVEPSEEWQAGHIIGDSDDIDFLGPDANVLLSLRRCRSDFENHYFVVSGIKLLDGKRMIGAGLYEHVVVWVVFSKGQVPKKGRIKK